MRALAKGIFQIRPRVLFVDEKGTYRSYDFEPVAITVRELGISGWLKGPGSGGGLVRGDSEAYRTD